MAKLRNEVSMSAKGKPKAEGMLVPGHGKGAKALHPLVKKAEWRYTRKELWRYMGVTAVKYNRLRSDPFKYMLFEQMMVLIYCARIDITEGLEMLIGFKHDAKLLRRAWYEENGFASDNYIYVNRGEMKRQDDLFDEIHRLKLLIAKLARHKHVSKLDRDWNPNTDLKVLAALQEKNHNRQK